MSTLSSSTSRPFNRSRKYIVTTAYRQAAVQATCLEQAAKRPQVHLRMGTHTTQNRLHLPHRTVDDGTDMVTGFFATHEVKIKQISNLVRDDADLHVWLCVQHGFVRERLIPDFIQCIARVRDQLTEENLQSICTREGWSGILGFVHNRSPDMG